MPEVNVWKVVGSVSLLLQGCPSLGSALAPTLRCSLTLSPSPRCSHSSHSGRPPPPSSSSSLPKEPLQHVRRAYPGVVRSWVGKVGKGVPYARLEDRDGLREAPTVKLYELLGQSPRRLLSPHLEDRFEILRHLGHRGGRHVGQDVALKMYGAPLPLGTRQLAEDRSLYTLMVVRDHQLHATQPPVQ